MAKSKKNHHVQATTFSLVDADGELRALMSTDPGTHLPEIRLFDKNGCMRLAAGINPTGAGLTLFREDGKVVIGIGTADLGSYAIEQFHSNGGLALSMTVSEAGGLEVVAFDSNGGCVWSLGEDNKGGAEKAGEDKG